MLGAATATTQVPTVTSESDPGTCAVNVVVSVQVTAVCASVPRSCMTVPVTDAIWPDAPPRCGSVPPTVCVRC